MEAISIKKKHKAGKIILIVVAVLVFLLLAAAAAGYIYLNSLLNLMDRTEITGDESLTEEEVYAQEPTYDVEDSVDQIEDAQDDYRQSQKLQNLQDGNIENILLIGSDRRSSSENGRSDSMMIVSLNHDTGKIHIVSLMRAMYVNIPRASGDTWGMLNAAYSWGGTDLLIKTIETNFRISIDHYVVVDFSSFMTAVDLVGGVRIKLTSAEAQYLTTTLGDTFTAGTYTLNGKQALTYSRIRKIDNDFIRTSRQRNVIIALIDKAKTLNLSQLLELANRILPAVSTDLTNSEVMDYLSQALTILNYPISQRMLPIENEAGKSFTGRIYVNGREMYKVDFIANIKALHEFLLS